LAVNWLGERNGRATHDAERKSRTARAVKEDGDQVWASGLDGEGDEDARNHVLAALQRTAWGAAGADRTPPYWGHLVKPSKGREQDVRIDPNGPRRREAGSTPAQIIAPARTLRGVLVLRRPDEETLAFWKMTADDFQEYGFPNRQIFASPQRQVGEERGDCRRAPAIKATRLAPCDAKPYRSGFKVVFSIC